MLLIQKAYPCILVESFYGKGRAEKVCHPTQKEFTCTARCLGLHGPGPGFLSEQVTHPEAVDLRHFVARHQAV